DAIHAGRSLRQLGGDGALDPARERPRLRQLLQALLEMDPDDVVQAEVSAGELAVQVLRVEGEAGMLRVEFDGETVERSPVLLGIGRRRKRDLDARPRER